MDKLREMKERLKEKIDELSLKQKIIIIIIILLLLLLLLIIIFRPTFSSSDGNPSSDSPVVDIDVGEEVVSVNDVEITEYEGITKYTATIKANSDSRVEYIEIKFLDNQKKELITLIGYVGSFLNKGETKKIEASTEADLSTRDSIEYNVVE